MTEPLDLSPKPAPIPEATPTPTADEPINPGYNPENTLSYAETATSNTPPSVEGINELPQNDNNNPNFNSYLSASLKHRVEAFQNTLTELNTHFFSQYKGNTLAILEGAATLIMFLGGSLHGFKIANTLNSVLENETNQKNQITKEQKKSALETKINNLDETINEIKSQKDQQLQQVNQLNSSIENKNQEITKLSDTDAIDKIQQEIASLYQQSNELISALNNSNQQLQQNNNIKTQDLKQKQLLTYLITALDNSITNIDNTIKDANLNSTYHLNKMAEQIEESSEKFEEKSIENTEELSQINKKNLQQQIEESKLKAHTNKKDNDISNQLLTPNLLLKLQTIFFPISDKLTASTEANNLSPENIQQVAALILAADIEDKKQPDLAHKQPHLGDSLSLEGADNPVAYGILLLMHNMEQLQESLINTEQLESAEEQEQELIQQMFELQNKAELIVLNSLNQSDTPDFHRRITA
jgi:hypothetical protein